MCLEAACAESDILHNMPFEVTSETVCAPVYTDAADFLKISRIDQKKIRYNLYPIYRTVSRAVKGIFVFHVL